MKEYRVYFVHVGGNKMYIDVRSNSLIEALRVFYADYFGVYSHVYSISEVSYDSEI